MLNGVVVKAYNSYYYIQTGDKLISCSLRGRIKKERFSLLVGDEVTYSLVGPEKGVIEEILPRRNMLKRPMLANVDQVILTFAAVNPDINPSLIDRFLVIAEHSQLDIIICINKLDLADGDTITELLDRYRSIGYPILTVSAKTGQNINALRALLFDKISVLAGPSGAGKSTILNAVQPGLELVTGEVSSKIGRGKHTTRFAELLPLAGGGFVVDTPGFSYTEFQELPSPELAFCFPEIVQYASGCKFTTCLHFKEPQCAVKQAVDDGKIHTDRYQSYIEILTEINENKKGF
ncbi:MAG TPA: ribosome small subunit-dependent GTPase A [Methylomusa anaerophila]|uniref:Small ribosomal subunit biogenesis GTPase RsgA n=1 Tax=Methylomusa anaerophila TaxID=1930071 RepID=A0A348APP1_9FIRM|nr:ribosome small subunit-dependent GTPase A [Methylomusa anaerophila]BBB93039.1 putative ribosome biogenesis GTPase RsgA [Methylomusa anaerophila]HML87127.1 ribosome small subunit-dependent GTPase A [Methylomusa anaerophila]